jgi:hypothetical protein
MVLLSSCFRNENLPAFVDTGGGFSPIVNKTKQATHFNHPADSRVISKYTSHSLDNLLSKH